MSGQLRVSADFEPTDGTDADTYGNIRREGGRHGSIGGDKNRHGSIGGDGSRQGSIGGDGNRHGSIGGDGSRHGSIGRDGSRHGSIGGDGSRRDSALGDGPDSRRSSASSGRPGAKLSESMPGHKTSLPRGPGQLTEEPVGNLHLEILQGKDLVKSDIMGKSDPYAVVTYGDDKIKTKTVKNSQNPEWNFQADIPIDPNGPSNLQIEVFDKDKLGRDKPLGAANIDIPSLMNNAIP